MANYLGYFFQGMASGIQSGFEMGWKKKQKKELEAAQKKVIEEGAVLNNAAAEMMKDKIITDDEMVKWNALILASGKEVREMSKGWDTAIKEMNAKGCEQYKQRFEMMSENIASFNPADFSQSYEEAIKYYPGQQIYFDTANNIIKKKHEAMQTQPIQTPAESTMGTQNALDYKRAVDYLSKFINTDPDSFNKIKEGLQKNTGLDLSVITQESLRDPNRNLPPEIAPQTEKNVEPAPIEPYTEETPPKPSLLQKGVSTVKNWLNMKGTPQQKDYTTLTEAELYQQLKAADPESEEYIALYEEAKRRGLVK